MCVCVRLCVCLKSFYVSARRLDALVLELESSLRRGSQAVCFCAKCSELENIGKCLGGLIFGSNLDADLVLKLCFLDCFFVCSSLLIRMSHRLTVGMGRQADCVSFPNA